MSNKIKIANAPCSWGVLEFALKGEAAGYQQVLDEIAATGYEGTELGDWGFMPTDPAALKYELGKRDLDLLGAFVPVALSEKESHIGGVQKALQVAGLMYEAGYSQAFIVLADDNGKAPFRTKNAGRLNGNGNLGVEERKVFATGTEKIAEAVKNAYGIRTVFHHHCAGYIETPEEINWLMELTNPELVGLCFDTGHYQFGGGRNPIEVLEKYWSRIWHLHFKDFSSSVASTSAQHELDYFQSVNNGVFCELGKGSVNFRAIKEYLEQKGYEGWIVVEQDVLPGMGNPKQCATDNRKYLQEIGL